MKIWDFSTTKKMLRKESGAALMMAIFTVTLLMIIATEVMYETNVELAVSSQSVNQVKAHYAAKAGVEIGLLRLHIFRKASAMAVSANAPSTVTSMLDMIWTTPFMWPPVVPEEVSLADKDSIQASVKASMMQASYSSNIASESGKLDINDLGSPIKGIAESAKKQLLQIFESKMESDEDFATKHQGADFNALMSNIADWVDEDSKSSNGGDESSLYADLPNASQLPPNQSFKTFEELHMVAGMTDEYYDLLLPRITIFGAKGVNVNYATKEVLKSLGPKFTDQVVDEIIKARTDPNRGFFKDDNDFVGFLSGLGITKNDLVDPNNPNQRLPFLYDPEFNFRISSIGQSGRVSREITAIVYDFDQVANHLKSHMPTPAPPTPPPGATATPATPTPTPAPPKVPNERPNIVYWNEN